MRNPEKGDELEDLGVGGSGILKYILTEKSEKAWIGLIWLRLWTSGGLL